VSDVCTIDADAFPERRLISHTMDPQKYQNPTLVNSPFRNELVSAISRVVGEGAEGVLDRLFPLLDGSRSVADIYGRLISQDISTDIASRVLGELDAMGCLADLHAATGGPGSMERMAKYHAQVACLEEWLKVRQNPDEARTGGIRAQSSLAEARLIVMGLGRTGSSLIEAMALAGVGRIFGIRSEGDGTAEDESAALLPERVRSLNPLVQYVEITSVENDQLGGGEKDAKLPLLVYCPDDFREEVCRQLNTLSLTMGSSLLVYRDSPFSVEMGPLVIPRKTACYVCYELRRKAAEPNPDPEETSPAGGPALNFSCGAQLLALEIVKILTRTAFPVTQGKLWRLGLFDGAVSVHPVLKLPRCPECGVQRSTPPRRIWEE
jgi:bacteriocin biosynthesis cyclodehydratase domain-containing protein